MILTYTRGQWIASVIALGLSTLFLAPSDKAQLLRQALAAGLVVLFIIIIGVFGPPFEQQFESSAFAEALTERATSIFTPQQTFDSASLQWRLFENEEAIKSIMKHPIVGVGLGNAYRDITLLQGEARGWWGTLASGSYGRFTRYVHNSYLYVTVKMGLTGMLALAWFFISFLWQGRRLYKALPDSHFKRLILVILASFVAVLPWSITQAHFMQVESTTAIGLMAGLVATMYQMDQRGKEPGRALLRREG
jgi:O-antigen ligase